MRRESSHGTKSVKYFTLHLGIKHFMFGRLNFTVDQILHLNKHGKMCKIFFEKYFSLKQKR